LAETNVDVAVDLLKTAAQLIDPVHRVLNASRQLPHLRLQSIHPQLDIDRSRPRTGDLGRAPSVYLPLQHAQITLQVIQAVLHGPLLSLGSWVRQG